jgi:tRNA A-37 threonylcarbamoyl transferase component Bud32
MATALADDDIARVLAIAAPSEEVATWRVTPDAYPVLTPSTEALDRVVAGTVGGRHVRVFVKTIHSMRHWPMIGMLPPEDQRVAIDRFPWRTEADVYASSLVRDLPDGLRAPRIFSIDDLGDDRIRIWMEDLPEAAAPWDPARYADAARRLGRLAGRTHRDGLPADTPPLFGGLRMLWAMRITNTLVPVLRDDATWRHPLMAAMAASDPALRGDLLALADEAPSILDALDQLPRGLAHGDACPQNLLRDPDRPGGFVAIDWGFANLAPLGSDLAQLLAGRADSGELSADELPAIQEAILVAYLDGLRDERVDASAAQVRRAFLWGLVVGKAFSALPLERLGGPVDDRAEAFFLARARYARYLLDLRPALARDA